MTLKITIFYNQATQGWTETYYATGSNPSSYLAGLPDSFYRGLLALRDADVDLFAIRATVLGSVRLSYRSPSPDSTIAVWARSLPPQLQISRRLMP